MQSGDYILVKQLQPPPLPILQNYEVQYQLSSNNHLFLAKEKLEQAQKRLKKQKLLLHKQQA